MFELLGYKDRNQDLVDCTLDENYGNEAEDGVRGAPNFQEPLEVETRLECVAVRETEFKNIPGIQRIRSSQVIRANER
jgi:hypothetical protein